MRQSNLQTRIMCAKKQKMNEKFKFFSYENCSKFAVKIYHGSCKFFDRIGAIFLSGLFDSKYYLQKDDVCHTIKIHKHLIVFIGGIYYGKFFGAGQGR